MLISFHISKVKSELKCSEADLVGFLNNYKTKFQIVHDNKGKPGIKLL